MPTVELGTGTTAFQGLSDGGDLGLIAGPQGGHHFIVHARAQHLSPGDPLDPSAPDNPRTVFLAFDDQGNRIDTGSADYTLGYLADDDWYVLPSGRLLLMEEETLPALSDRVLIRVELTDGDGDSAAQQRSIQVVNGGTLTADGGVTDGNGDGGM
jgi:hypothetical protein